MPLRAADCDFSNGLQEGPTDSGITVDITLNTTGTKHYACQIAGHCTAGNMNQQVIVTNCAAAGVVLLRHSLMRHDTCTSVSRAGDKAALDIGLCQFCF